MVSASNCDSVSEDLRQVVQDFSSDTGTVQGRVLAGAEGVSPGEAEPRRRGCLGRLAQYSEYAQSFYSLVHVLNETTASNVDAPGLYRVLQDFQRYAGPKPKPQAWTQHQTSGVGPTSNLWSRSDPPQVLTQPRCGVWGWVQY